MPPLSFAELPGRVHRNDLMLEGTSRRCVDAYAEAGRQAVELMKEALAAGGRSFEDVRAVLDLGCGHGRVTRWLVRQVPPQAVTACDIDTEAVMFCAREFQVVPLIGSEDFDSVDFATYDLVWAGSLATHLPEAAWSSWVSLLPRLLNPEGLAVFTTHEPALMSGLGRAARPGGPAEVVAASLARSGFAYVPYSHYGHDRYGIAFHDPERVDQDLSAAGLTRVLFRRRGWVNHQDVHAFALVGQPSERASLTPASTSAGTTSGSDSPRNTPTEGPKPQRT
jgi:SAM-dependent methyltransferase